MYKFLSRLALAACAVVISAATRAEWPERPIRVVVPYSPGVGGDLIVRSIADDLARRLGQPVIVENREGAAGNVGTLAASRAAPDGYTLLVAQTSNFVVNQHLYRSFVIDPVKAFVPIIHVGNTPTVLLTSVNVPANDFPAFAAHAQAQKGRINFGTAGVGTVGHLTLEALNRSQGLGMTSIAYRGAGQVLTGLVAGELHAGFALPGLASQYIQAGKVRPLAVLGDRRLPSLPDTPSFKELGLDKVGGETWWAVVAPAGTPEAVLNRLNVAMRQALSAPVVRKRLEDLGVVPAASTREEVAERWRREGVQWRRTVKELGIQLMD